MAIARLLPAPLGRILPSRPVRLPAAIRRNRPVAVFCVALATLVCIDAPLRAYDSGMLGPHDAGARILLNGPLRVVRGLRVIAALVAVAYGRLILRELRRQWEDYTDGLLAADIHGRAQP